MSGRLFGVVGPSGVGKDTVMAALQEAVPNLHVSNRVITRASNAGGEVFLSVRAAEFVTMAAAGEFALWWTAHGLSYGIPSSVEEVLAGGQDVLVNLSRNVLHEAAERFQRFEVISLTAPREVLAARLAARGREKEADILARLKRSTRELPRDISILEISNDRPLDVVVADIFNTYFANRGSL